MRPLELLKAGRRGEQEEETGRGERTRGAVRERERDLVTLPAGCPAPALRVAAGCGVAFNELLHMQFINVLKSPQPDATTTTTTHFKSSIVIVVVVVGVADKSLSKLRRLTGRINNFIECSSRARAMQLVSLIREECGGGGEE